MTDSDNIDLADETQAALESVSAEVKQEHKRIAIRSVLIGSGFCAVFLVLFVLAEGMRSDWFAGSTVAYEVFRLTDLSLLQIVLTFGVVAVGMPFIIGGIRRFLVGPPLAGVTIDESLASFYEAASQTLYLGHCGKVGVAPYTEAYQCLLEQAKRACGGYYGFVDSLKRDSRELWQQLSSKYEQLAEVSLLADVSADGKTETSGGALTTAEQVFTLVAKSVGAHNSRNEIGRCRLSLRKDLVQIAGRYYLTSAQCTWKFLDDGAPANDD
ncbi:MAG: hypothetical protein QGI24_10050 [Kiritimatiellia bacterium]|jgi:hypothetical protein|nr:hypothetical protein [Kiritimatiellia bacterium]MDP6849117.1 hypothetical protein [Kiritimatiellia bacterium]